MKPSMSVLLGSLLAAFTALLIAPVPSGAGTNGALPSATTHPDWSGAWIIPEPAFVQSVLRELQPGDPQAPVLTPEYARVLKAIGVRMKTGKDIDPTSPVRMNSERCLPPGMPDVMRYPAAIEFLFTPGRVTLISEEGPLVRRIPTDNRKHRADAEPTYSGESVGRWEGSTLVVDTTAISAKAQLLNAIHTSGRAHVVERIHLRDATHLQIDTVVDDPIVLRTPWRYTRIYERINPDFVEYVCLDNDRDPNGDEPDLTPPSMARIR
jgi:hypothetical protein